MPYIRRLKKGNFPGWGGSDAYETIEVDDFGNPVAQNNPITKEMDNINRSISRTEPKIGQGIRAPDYAKGYKKGETFDYHLYNKLRSEGKLKSQRKKNRR